MSNQQSQQAPGKVFSGARAVVQVYNGDTAETIGIFSQCSYGITYEYASAFILGRYSAAALEYTSLDVVQLQCHGYRVAGHGWHVAGRIPYLNQLMRPNILRFQLFDRATDQAVATITNVIATSASGGYTARQLSELQVSYVGLLVSDESDPDGTKMVEPSAPTPAADLP
jgi:hypothetical protein